MQKKVFMIGGIRGSGKSTVCKILSEQYPDRILLFDKSLVFPKTKQTLLQYFQEFVVNFISSEKQILIIDRFFQDIDRLIQIDGILKTCRLCIYGFITINVSPTLAFMRTQAINKIQLTDKVVKRTTELKLLNEIKKSKLFLYVSVPGNKYPQIVAQSINVIISKLHQQQIVQIDIIPINNNKNGHCTINTKQKFIKKVFNTCLNEIDDYQKLIKKLTAPLTLDINKREFFKNHSTNQHMIICHDNWKSPCCCTEDVDYFEYFHKEWMFEIISYNVRIAHIYANKVLKNTFNTYMQNNIQLFDDYDNVYLNGNKTHMRFQACVKNTKEKTIFALEQEIKTYIDFYLKIIVVHNKQICENYPKFTPIINRLSKLFFIRQYLIY
jgi:hypothetical protein